MANILLAEDDESMLNFLVIALERAGHKVLSTRNGMDAFNILKDRADFDLLLTDIVMPGMDGIELANKASDAHKNLKIMFITGFAGMAIKNANETAQDKPQILSKPFHLNDLVLQVEELLSA